MASQDELVDPSSLDYSDDALGNNNVDDDDLPQFLEFNESDSDGSAAHEDDDGLGGSLTMAEMDLIFSDDDKAMFQRIAQKIEEEEEQWLDENLEKDPEKVVSELANRQGQTIAYLSKLRKKRFLELGGRRKSRSLLMRYGITHTKVFREARALVFECPETNPRSVSNALLKRLKSNLVDEGARFEHLQRVFAFCVEKQRDDIEMNKFQLVQEAPHSTAEIDAVGDTSSVASGNNQSSVSRSEPPVAEVPEVRKTKSIASSKFGLGEKHFVRGMARLFSILATLDRKKTPLTITKTRRRKKGPEEVSVVFEQDPSVIRQRRAELEAWDRVEKQIREDVESDAEEEELSRLSESIKACGGVADDFQLPREPDFLEMGGMAIGVGLRLLFEAIDINERGWITCDELVTFLLDSSLLVQIGVTGVEQKEYEFMYSGHIADISDAMYIKSREMLVACSNDIVFFSGDAKLASRGVIKSPTDPYTLVPLYRASSIEYIPAMKVVAAGFTDGFVRFFTTASILRPKLLCQLRLDSTPFTLLFFRDHLYCGTRMGTVVMIALKYRERGYEATIRAQSNPHSDVISSIIAVPVENAVMTSSFDGTTALHDCKSLKLIFSFPQVHQRGVRDVAYLCSVNIAISIGFDGTILVWTLNLIHQPPMRVVDHVVPHTASLCSVCAIDASASFATMDERGMIKIWDGVNYLCLQTIQIAHYCPASDSGSRFVMMFVHMEPPSNSNPLGLIQLFCFSRYRMYVFEYNHSQRPVILRNTADDDSILFVGYSYNERVYITVTNKTVRVWDAPTSTIRDTFRCWVAEENGGITAAALNPNGKAFYIGCMSGCVMAKNCSTGSTVYQSILSHSTEVVSMQFGTGAAGYGDVLLSVSLECVTIHTADFRVVFRMPGVENARCIEYDAQSMCAIIGDSLGLIGVYLTSEVTPGRCDPHVVLQHPKKVLRPISSMCVLHGLSSFVAADEDGQIALFSLKYHPRAFSCIAVWNHVSDSSTMIPMVSTMHFSTSLWSLYCGDEMGLVTVYNLKDAIARGQASASAANFGSGRSLLRREKSSSALGRLSHESSFSSVAALKATSSFRSPVKNRVKASLDRKVPAVNLLVDPLAVDSHATIGQHVTIINRWLAHEELVTCIYLIQPPPDAVTPMQKHSVLLTCSMDQCCYAWSNAGCRHIGALEQYQRCHVEITSVETVNDLDNVELNRERQLQAAKRDMVKLRVKGLVRKAGTHTFTIVPPDIIAAAQLQAGSTHITNSPKCLHFQVTVPSASSLISVEELESIVAARRGKHITTSDTPPSASAASSPRGEHHDAQLVVIHQALTRLPLQQSLPRATDHSSHRESTLSGILPSSQLVVRPLVSSVVEERLFRMIADDKGLHPKLSLPEHTSPQRAVADFHATVESSEASGKSTPACLSRRTSVPASSRDTAGAEIAGTVLSHRQQINGRCPSASRTTKDPHFGYHRGSLEIAAKGRKKLLLQPDTNVSEPPLLSAQDAPSPTFRETLDERQKILSSDGLTVSTVSEIEQRIPKESIYLGPLHLLTQLAPALRDSLSRPKNSLHRRQPRYSIFRPEQQESTFQGDVPARYSHFGTSAKLHRGGVAPHHSSPIEPDSCGDMFKIEPVLGKSAVNNSNQQRSLPSERWVKSADIALRSNIGPTITAPALPEMPCRIASAAIRKRIPKQQAPS